MNQQFLKLFASTATAATLALAGVNASASQWLGENVPFDAAADEPAAVPFEANYSDSTTMAAGMMLDLPVDYFSESSFPPMPDFGADEPPLLLAGLDPTQTP
jgi:hypothetical protein